LIDPLDDDLSLPLTVLKTLALGEGRLKYFLVVAPEDFCIAVLTVDLCCFIFF
jgi:hypothetical protein